MVDEQERELVAAEPERLPALTEPSGDLGQHTIAELQEIAGDVTPADFPPV